MMQNYSVLMSVYYKETKGRHAFNGMAYAIIRAGQTTGKLKLTVSGAGKDASLGTKTAVVDRTKRKELER